MNVLSLFAGIGGIDLGLEWAGMRTVAFCEREPAAQFWLREHWPGVPIYDDVRTLSGESLRRSDVGPIDVIAGGAPCQPFSVAGKQKGTEDERHLWPHFARLIEEIRPRWVLAENVPGLRTIAADLVLEDLEKLGYTAWPLVVGADDVGAPHRRKRVWIVAHRYGGGRGDERVRGNDADGRGIRPVGEPTGAGLEGQRTDAGEPQESESRDSGARMADPESHRLERRPTRKRPEARPTTRARGVHRWPARPGDPQHEWEAPRLTKPGMGDSADGLPRWVAGYTSAHRREALNALGNAVVPQVVEIIGRGIMQLENAMRGEA